MPSNNNVTGSGDHVGDHNKLVDAINEIRASVPNQASEVNAAPNVILNSSGKVLDAYLASAFVKTVNGVAPDGSGNVVVTVTGGYDGTDAVKISGNQTVAGVKTFTSAPASSADAVNSNDLVRKSQLDTKANAAATVNLSGDQTVAGVKSFSSPPVSLTAAATANQLVRKNELDLKADASSLTTKADSNSVVLLTTAQTVAGVKTFAVPPVSATTASSDSQLINFGQVKSLIPGQGTPSSIIASQNWDSVANGTVPDYPQNVIPNGNATGASVTVQNGALKWVSPSSAGSVNRKFWYSDTPNADADITLSFTWDGTGTNAQAWFVFRSTGNSIDRSTGTMFLADFSNGAYDAGRSVGGTYTAYSALAGPKAFTFTANTKYKLRALLVGQRVRYKVWIANFSEPNAWSVDLSDPTDFAGAPATAGIQFGAGTQSTLYVDDLVFATPATGTIYAQTVNNVAPDSNGNIAITTTQSLTARTFSGTTYTLSAADVGSVVEATSSNTSGSLTVTLPNDSTLNVPVGTLFYIQQFTGGATVNVSAASGVTLAGQAATGAFTSLIMLRKRSANTWVSTVLY
jgi:hypothetical protein